MATELHREIMKGQVCGSNFLGAKSQENNLKYNRQCNFWKKRLRTTKTLCFSSLDIKKVVDNRSFGKAFLQLCWIKFLKGEKIIFNENNVCLQDIT